ncbi:MAG: YicC family protein [Bdellovibrionaceae bacterium]|nr:YicC family protein [Pseudobdellovibrionaceae bacterium]
MKSMTGYGSAKRELKNFQIEINIKSVNGRFLELRFHMPKEYVTIESDMRKVLSENFARGTVDVFCSRKVKNHSESTGVEINFNLAEKIHKELTALSKKLKLQSEIHLSQIITSAPILRVREDVEISKSERGELISLLSESVKKCLSERIREGQSLKKEFLNLLMQLSRQVDEIKKLKEMHNQDVSQRLKEKIRNKGLAGEIDDAKFQQELFFWTEKTDIAEEIQRLEEHLRNYRNLLLSKSSNGKKIDFYTQELLREINTIGSKSQSSKITQYVVESKSLIEKLKEQAQNIE